MKSLLQKLLYKIKRPFHFIKTGLLRGLRGQIEFGFPAKKIKIIAITGTDGKTTTSTLLYHLLQVGGKKTALISTVAAYLGDDELATGLHVTSPDPYQLHRLIKRMVDEGIEYLVLEVTSHGAYQFRTWGIKPTIVGLTNIAHEHLDYHLNLEEYMKAKSLILNKSPQLVANTDADYFSTFRSYLKHPAQQIINFGESEKIPQKISRAIKNRFPEHYNQLNARLAYKIVNQIGLDNKSIVSAYATFPGIPGRMQEIQTKRQLRVIVDFAHTPQGLEAVLTALQTQLPKKNKLIAVYGAAGLRDRKKRPIMGQIGARLADYVVFTAEDPRTEDVWSIIRQLKENLDENIDKVMSIPDRKEAINFAINKLAKPGDIVAILGKGHEQSMCFGKTEYPWSDVKVAKQILTTK